MVHHMTHLTMGDASYDALYAELHASHDASYGALPDTHHDALYSVTHDA